MDRRTAQPTFAASAASSIDRLAPYVLSILRIVVALLFLEHGSSKLFGFPQPMAPPGLGNVEWFAAVIEFAGGILLALGFFTRPAAFIMSGEMAVGYFVFHATQAFFPILNRGDAAILYCFVFLLSLSDFRRLGAVEPRRAVATTNAAGLTRAVSCRRVLIASLNLR